MSKTKVILIYLGLFLLGLVSAIRLEDDYRQLLRNLYCALTYNRISFEVPKVDFFFFTIPFIFSLAVYFMFAFYLLSRQKLRAVIINGSLMPLFFVFTILVYVYFGGHIILLECTACDDGTILLPYDALNYTRSFVIALLTSLLPPVSTELRMRREKAKAKRFTTSF